MKTLAASLVLLAALATPAVAGPQEFDHINAGYYQSILGDCQGCHTRPGGEPYAGGEPLETPFGKIVPPNITPDKETGIGNWTEAEFRSAMKEGIGKGGEHLYPAMPYPAYSKMTDGDIANLWAYMQTLKPVHRAVRANLLPFPFNIRLVMKGWNWINFKPQPFKADPSKSDEWNRGAYIVTGAGHCGTCHTPKTTLGADKDSEALMGASLAGWFAPNITNDKRLGIGNWSQDDIVAYLKTGRNAHSVASGPMAEAVENSTSRMSDADLKAIAVYLSGHAPSSQTAQPSPVSVSDPHMKAGQAIYQANCSACHSGDGKGEGQLFPPLAGNSIVMQSDAETLAHVTLAGTQAAYTKEAPTAPAMPSFAWRLDDQEVADVLTYVRNSWGNAAAPVAADAVRKVRAALHEGS
ncbi:MAG TPA: cytochrome c [Rhizobiaceae bacterium]|jgi:mono/diheme cytochrome c family protein|nr:cytochrome c [Rhizobiaceae bacterium]